eukprot:Em0020g524a
MRVDLAAQVLSESVSKAVELIGGVEAAETAKFLIMFDKFFDCLNVSNCSEGHQQRKPFREPYRSADDFRLKWLEEDFLGYISDWETYVKNIDGVSQKMRQKMLLSPQTLLGLKMTDHQSVAIAVEKDKVKVSTSAKQVNHFQSEKN